jgi:hypothetical protein
MPAPSKVPSRRNSDVPDRLGGRPVHAVADAGAATISATARANGAARLAAFKEDFKGFIAHASAITGRGRR